MKRRPLILLLVVATAFGAGMVQFFRLRFEAGDMYPPHSSLRADPLGAKALHDSLGRLVPVRRHFQRLSLLGEGAGVTLLRLGADPRELRADPDELRHLEQFVGEGGRLVIALYPQIGRPRPGLLDWAEGPRATNRPAAKDEPEPKRPRRGPFEEDLTAPEPRPTDLAARWKFSLNYAVATTDERGVLEPIEVTLKTSAPLPPILTWRSAAFFQEPDPVWRVVYARERNRPVVMERHLGSGTIVLLTDSYYFSNEALRAHRHPDLLAWLVGPGRRVIFDETHLGVSEQPGVATLAREYRLHGLILALALLVALYLWKNAVSFLPPPEPEAGAADVVAGRDAAAGFVNLLRRNIHPGDLFPVCRREWERSCGRTVSPAKREAVRRVLAAGTGPPDDGRDPVETYRRCCAVLARPGRDPQIGKK